MPFGKAEPHGVLVEQQDPIPPAVGSVTVSAIGQLLWRICQDVYAYRRVMPPVGRADVGGGWEPVWVDAPVTRLNGRTPRQTAASRNWPLLEALLRQFEYDADLLAAQGQRGIDTDWLRQRRRCQCLAPHRGPSPAERQEAICAGSDRDRDSADYFDQIARHHQRQRDEPVQGSNGADYAPFTLYTIGDQAPRTSSPNLRRRLPARRSAVPCRWYTPTTAAAGPGTPATAASGAASPC